MSADATVRATPAERLESLSALCERTLHANWRQGERAGVRYAYTAPSPIRYPWQWYWDSCQSAVVWARLQPARARAELETLLAAAQPDGFIGHTIFWSHPVGLPRLLFYNVSSRADQMTATIQPPMLAWAWRIAVGDPAAVPAIVAHHAWIREHRDICGDGLIWILQPDESGLDASPSFDAVWGRRAQGLPGFALLVRRNRQLGFDIKRVRAAGGPLVCPVVANVLHALSELALGRPSPTAALIERLYDERTGRFVDRALPERADPGPLTWSTLAPLALPDLPAAIGRRLVEQHLLDPTHFWLPLAPPAVAADEPSFSTRATFWGLRRYWRGPTWINSTWLVSLGLRRLGYHALAQELAERVAAVVLREGLREYYQPFSGAGMGARDFAWSALVLELLDPSAGAAGSHL